MTRSLVGFLSVLLLGACGPVSPGGNDNPCGLEAPSCASDSEEYACDGLDVVVRACAGYEVCADGLGCTERLCYPGEIQCVDGDTEQRCVAPGHAWGEEVDCSGGLPCTPGVGCTPPVCVENQRICLGPDQVGICNADHTDYDPLLLCSDTDPTSICHDGQCVSACDRAELTQSYLGCEYWAADLPQYPNNVSSKDYAIVVTNPSDAHVAHVTIYNSSGVVTTLDVQPRSAATYSVQPRPYNIPGSGQWPYAYRVESDWPVAVYQFNSLTTIQAASTDASLLFASHTLATKYYVMDYDGFSHGDGDNFVAVYAVEDDTQVTVTPTQNLRASMAGSQVSFAASSAGTPVTFTLQRFQVLVLMAEGVGVSLTGTQVEGSAPIGVFGGNRCTQVPNGMSYCDHIEQQIFPRQALGTTYVVSKTHARTSCTVEDRIRVLADSGDVDDPTIITVEPPVAGPFLLHAGQWEEFGITDHVVLTSDKPFYVGQFIRSSNSSECNDEADPAFILQVPVEQFRLDYVFLTPETYTTDYLAIIAPPGASVQLDGSPVTLNAVAVGTSGYSVTDVVLTPDGPHRLESSEKVGIIVYGYGGPSGADPNGVVNVSYGYPGGLDLVAINPVE